MGFRFRKNISLFPGLRINLSKGGVSTSLGRLGATINIGKRGLRGTVGLPGTGLSYSDFLTKPGQVGEPFVSLQDQPPATANSNGNFKGPAIVGVGLLGVLLGMNLTGARSPAPDPNVSASGTVQPEARASILEPETRTIAVTSANCRTGPGKSNEVVAKLRRGMHVQVKEDQAGWTRVETSDLVCWVNRSLMV